jgi:hypothetical protein
VDLSLKWSSNDQKGCPLCLAPKTCAEARKTLCATSIIIIIYCLHLVRPNDLAGHSDYHLFKEGILPMWEVRYNILCDLQLCTLYTKFYLANQFSLASIRKNSVVVQMLKGIGMGGELKNICIF